MPKTTTKKIATQKPEWATRDVATISAVARVLPEKAAAAFLRDRLLIGRSDEIWSYAADLARELFDDYQEVNLALNRAHSNVSHPLFDELERAILAVDRRNCEAAYRLGFEVGRRATGGTR